MSFFKNPKGYPKVPLIEVASLKRGYDLPVQNRVDGSVPIYAANGQNGNHNQAKATGPGVVTGRSGTIGKVHYVEGDYWPLNTALYVTDFHGNHPKWVYYMLQAFKLERFVEGAGVPTLNRNLVHGELIPLPPLSEQKRIVAILDKADSLRRKNQQAIQIADKFLRAVFLDMFGDPVTNPKEWEKKTLGELIKVSSGDGLTSSEMDKSGQYPVYGGNGVNGYHDKYMFEEPQLVIGRVGVYCGSIHITNPKSWVTDNALYIKEYKREMDIDFMAESLRQANLNQYAGKAAQPLVSGSRIYPIEIMLPPIESQKSFSRVKNGLNSLLNKSHQSRNIGDDFFNALSQKAFAGEL